MKIGLDNGGFYKKLDSNRKCGPTKVESSRVTLWAKN